MTPIETPRRLDKSGPRSSEMETMAARVLTRTVRLAVPYRVVAQSASLA